MVDPTDKDTKYMIKDKSMGTEGYFKYTEATHVFQNFGSDRKGQKHLFWGGGPSISNQG